VAGGAGYYTGLALVNGDDAYPSVVSLDVFDSAGNLTSEAAITLNPGEHAANILDVFLNQPIGQTDGYVHVTSTRPIYAMELIGSSDPGSLANITAQSVTEAAVSPVPAITFISPSTISTKTRTRVQIYGTGFMAGSAVNYDGVFIRS